jgi:CheY-like chemotaxis protein
MVVKVLERVSPRHDRAVVDALSLTLALLTIPVVILTTSDAETDRAKAYRHHANSYLVKPVNFDNFTRMMEDLGFYWLTWNHYPWPEANA